jgi:hypothetical protein
MLVPSAAGNSHVKVLRSASAFVLVQGLLHRHLTVAGLILRPRWRSVTLCRHFAPEGRGADGVDAMA